MEFLMHMWSTLNRKCALHILRSFSYPLNYYSVFYFRILGHKSGLKLRNDNALMIRWAFRKLVSFFSPWIWKMEVEVPLGIPTWSSLGLESRPWSLNFSPFHWSSPHAATSVTWILPHAENSFWCLSRPSFQPLLEKLSRVPWIFFFYLMKIVVFLPFFSAGVSGSVVPTGSRELIKSPPRLL